MNLNELIAGINAGTVDTLDGLVSGVLDGPTVINGNGKRICAPGISKCEPKTKVTYCSPGIIEIDCRGYSLRIENLLLETSPFPYLGFISSLVVKNCNGLILNNTKVRSASLTGIDLRNCSGVTVSSCESSGNAYAGMTLSGCRNARIELCHFRHNGIDIPVNGYGIALQGGPNNAVNKDVVITRCVAEWNLRKGIDVHCGGDVEISENHIRNVGDMGIYAVAESPAKNVWNVAIFENMIHNEAVSGKALSCSGIAVGSSNDGSAIPPESGIFRVTNNVITSSIGNIGVAGIQVYMPQAGPAPSKVLIEDNHIYQAGMPGRHYGVIVANREPPKGSPADYRLPEIGRLSISDNVIVCLNDCGAGVLASHAREVILKRNTVRCLGKAVYGIASRGAETLTDVDNVITGTFSGAALYCNERKRG